MNGQAKRSCVTPAGSVVSAQITTIEGLSPDSSQPVQKAWIELDVLQRGYCRSGMIMASAALLARKPSTQRVDPTDADIDKSITNICRCGTYQRIRAAIHLAAKMMQS